MFSKEILPLEYTKEFTEVVSNNSKFLGLFKPNSRAALEIAVDALRAMNVKIDSLTKEQKKYAESW